MIDPKRGRLHASGPCSFAKTTLTVAGRPGIFGAYSRPETAASVEEPIPGLGNGHRTATLLGFLMDFVDFVYREFCLSETPENGRLRRRN
jgi:hypothetical protein